MQSTSVWKDGIINKSIQFLMEIDLGAELVNGKIYSIAT